MQFGDSENIKRFSIRVKGNIYHAVEANFESHRIMTGVIFRHRSLLYREKQLLKTLALRMNLSCSRFTLKYVELGCVVSSRTVESTYQSLAEQF